MPKPSDASRNPPEQLEIPGGEYRTPAAGKAQIAQARQAQIVHVMPRIPGPTPPR
jgi:hypothetical protein